MTRLHTLILLSILLAATACGNTNHKPHKAQSHTRHEQTTATKQPWPPTQQLLAKAEANFNNGKLLIALKTYRKILHSPQHTLHPFASYKISWCLYNRTEFRGALRSFIATLQLIKHTKDRSGSSPALDALHRETRRDLVHTYSHVGQHQRAQAFFKRHTPKHTMQMLKRLAKAYQHQRKYKQSNAIYNALLTGQTPLQDAVPHHLNIIENTMKSNGISGIHKEIQRLQSRWQHASHKLNHKTFTKLHARICQKVRILAAFQHRESIRTCRRAKKAREQAAQLYKDFFSFAPTSHVHRMRFYFAELRYKQRQYPQAIEQYQLAYQHNHTGQFAKDALFYSLLLYQRMMRHIFNAKRPKPHKEPLPQHAQAFIDISTTYLQQYQKDNRTAAIRYFVTRIYKHFRHDQTALQELRQLQIHHPTHKYTKQAAVELQQDNEKKR